MLRGLLFLSDRLQKLLALGGNTFLATTTGLTNLGTLGFGLIAQHLGAGLLRLPLVDVLDQDTLVLEHVTLRTHVQVVVQVTVDFLRLTVLLQQTTQHTHTVHPEQLLGHTGIGRTLSLTITAVATLAASDRVFAHTVTRVDHHRLLDDQTILDQFANVLSCKQK